MSNTVLIPLGAIGTLELPREVFEQHLVKHASTSNKLDDAALLSAEQLESRTGVPSSWWMSQARERRVPFRKLGRYVRFDYDEVLASESYRRRAVDSAGLPIQKGRASG